MEIKTIEYDLTVCKVKDEKAIDLSKQFYFIGKTDEEIREKIKRYALDNDYEIIEPSSINDPYYSIGPQEFISLIDGAKLVCTDSYHAAVFSINFNIAFYVADRNDYRLEGNHVESRIQSLLNQFGLESRYYNAIREFEAECDFTMANINLAKEREKFNKYIEKCLDI